MKKLLFPLAIIAISFASCSDDDSMPTPVDPTPVDPTPTPAVCPYSKSVYLWFLVLPGNQTQLNLTGTLPSKIMAIYL